MAITTSYSRARANLAKLLDQVTRNRQIVLIQRRNSEDAALIAADELAGLVETVRLLRSPTNAARLLHALESALKQ